MTFLTGLALRRSSVTLLVILLIMGGGVYVYNQLERELFPDVELSSVFIITTYPAADPETVMREVSEPIESAIASVDGLTETRSTSQESVSTVTATFDFGQDMKEAERAIQSQVNGINFPDEVNNPFITRVNNNNFPIMQITASGDRDIVSLQRLLDDLVIPRFERVPGVNSIDVSGRVDEQVIVTVNTSKLEDLGLSLNQVAEAISNNNISLPTGSITDGEITYPLRAAHELGSLAQIRGLTVGYESVVLPDDAAGPGASRRGQRPVLLSDVAEVELSTSAGGNISRTNGKPSLSITVVKDPDANTVDATRGIQAVMASLEGLPPDVELLELTNDGPEVERSLSNLLREGTLGFLFAITAVFLFLINLRPSILRGLAFTLRPTIIIGISIPLSVLSGILLMYAASMSLNFMSLAGLAIAVGRVVDDSIVVLENVYRHVQQGKPRMEAALVGTGEVGAAILSSTLTTVVVFIPLAFIQGIVGEFFTPLCPVGELCPAGLHRRSPDRRAGAVRHPAAAGRLAQRGQRRYRRGAGNLAAKALLPGAGLGDHPQAALPAAGDCRYRGQPGPDRVLPITFFPAGTPTSLTVNVELEPGRAIGGVFDHTRRVEQALEGFRAAGLLEIYQVTIDQATASATFTATVGMTRPRTLRSRCAKACPHRRKGWSIFSPGRPPGRAATTWK